MIHSPSASATTLTPYLLYGKPKQSRFSALKALRERQERQRKYIQKLDAEKKAEVRKFALAGLTLAQKIFITSEREFAGVYDDESR